MLAKIRDRAELKYNEVYIGAAPSGLDSFFMPTPGFRPGLPLCRALRALELRVGKTSRNSGRECGFPDRVSIELPEAALVQ
jgi:hypothetical protein